MGRSKGKLAGSAPYFELARWLRGLRHRAGLTYRQMAERIDLPGCSAVTLSRADSGCSLPKLRVVETYAEVCGGSTRQARTLWERAAAAAPPPPLPEAPERGLPRRAAVRPARPVELVHEPAHLLDAMQRLRLACGQPSLRELEISSRRRGFGPLPRSTLAEVLAGFRMPSEALLVSYVRSCGEHDHRVGLWRAAWARATGADAEVDMVGWHRDPVPV